jgi:hypothetical protein
MSLSSSGVIRLYPQRGAGQFLPCSRLLGAPPVGLEDLPHARLESGAGALEVETNRCDLSDKRRRYFAVRSNKGESIPANRLEV